MAAAVIPGPKPIKAFRHDLKAGTFDIWQDGQWQAVTPETYWPTWRGQETPDAA